MAVLESNCQWAAVRRSTIVSPLNLVHNALGVPALQLAQARDDKRRVRATVNVREVDGVCGGVEEDLKLATDYTHQHPLLTCSTSPTSG